MLDIADAMILKRLFESFHANRLILLLTSNRPPEDLYLNGLQRDLFLPFIDDLKENFKVINLSSVDYRLLNTMGMENYYYPLSNSEERVQAIWNKLTNASKGEFMRVPVAQGRTISCSRQAKSVGMFSFKELCEANRGSTDYMALAEAFTTLIIRGVPQMSMERRDILRRFISLIDALYYNHRNLIIEADVPLDKLFDIDAAD